MLLWIDFSQPATQEQCLDLVASNIQSLTYTKMDGPPLCFHIAHIASHQYVDHHVIGRSYGIGRCRRRIGCIRTYIKAAA